MWTWIKAFLRRHWTREKEDGKPAWGALRWLIVGIISTAAVLWLVGRMQQSGSRARAAEFIGGKRAPANPAAAQIQMRDVAASAQAAEPIRDRAVATDAFGRKIDGPAQTAAERVGVTTGADDQSSRRSFAEAGDGGRPQNSIFVALAQAEERPAAKGERPAGRDGRPVSDSGFDTSGFGRPAADGGFRSPNLGGTGSTGSEVTNSYTGQQQPQTVPIESLLARDIREVARQQPASQPTEAGQPQTIMKAERWLPRGEIIPVHLMQVVETGNMPTLIEFAVTKTIWFNGKPVVPFGTRFQASAGVPVRDRITFKVDTLRRRDGLAIAVSGVVLGEDRFTGMRSYYVPPATMAQVAPYTGAFLEAYADIMRERATRTSLSVGGVQVQQQSSSSEAAQEAAVSALSNAVSDFVKQNLSDIRERFAAYSTVLPGSLAYVQLTSDTSFDALWDGAPRGVARTVGVPTVSSTEEAYLARDSAARAPTMADLFRLASETSPAGTTPVRRAPRTAAEPARTTGTAGAAATTISDPFSR